VTTDSGVLVEPGAAIQGWDDGTVLSTTVATNGTGACVVQVNQATINGDVFVGTVGDPASDVCVIRSGTVTGSASTLAAANALPAVSAPAGLSASSGDLAVDAVHPGAIDGDATFDSISVSPGGDLTVTVPSIVHVTGDVDINQSAVMLSSGASLTLYVDGAFTVRRSADFGTTADTEAIEVYVTGAGPASVTPGSASARVVALERYQDTFELNRQSIGRIGGRAPWWGTPSSPDCPECGRLAFYTGFVYASRAHDHTPDIGLFAFQCEECGVGLTVSQV
jgi:hypothetical protein